MLLHFCVRFFFLPKQRPHPRDPGLRTQDPASRILPTILDFSLICMRAALRSALIVRRGHLGIKECQSTELSNHPEWRSQPRSTASDPVPASQRTITILFSVSVSVLSLSKIVLCTSCCRLVGSCLVLCLLPHSYSHYRVGKRLFIKKSSLIVWKEIMLILHFTRRASATCRVGGYIGVGN